MQIAKGSIAVATEPNLPDKILKNHSFKQLWNMNFGFLGIQFAWGLQMANMSAIFEYLGASAEQLPLLWLAAPITGLVIQPIIGNLSDHTWTFLGRRKPYFLVGAVFAAIALILIPQASTLWEAVALLWLLDSSNNLSMVPFRAFIADLLPPKDQSKGFAMQTIMVGIGAISASSLPWILTHLFNINVVKRQFWQAPGSPIPRAIAISFQIGAVLFLATILWTIITTPEQPPSDRERLERIQQQQTQRDAHHGITHGIIQGIVESIQATWQVLQDIPPQMKQLARVQFCSWLGAFCFFLYFTPAVAHNIFGAEVRSSQLYIEGVEWAGLCFALFNGVCVGFTWFLPRISAKIGQAKTHGLCLLCGGLSLMMTGVISNQYLLLLMMVGWGIAWSSMLTMPYAILSNSIPDQHQGIYQGIFNFYIVIPEIAVALGMGWVMHHFLQDNCLSAVLLGGLFLTIAAGLTLLIKSDFEAETSPQS